MPSVFVVLLGLYIPAMDLVMVRSALSIHGGRMVNGTCAARLGDAHKGVRSDDVVEVNEPKMSEQRNHQQGMGGCYL